MTTLLGQKSITFVPSSYIYDVVFSAVEFSAATGHATLSGPLSLSLDLINQTNTPWYIGIIIERDIGTISVADRAHIAGIDLLSSASISPASVPQLARINGNITKITVRVSVFPSVFYAPAGTSTVALRFDPPTDIISQADYIGRDTKVLFPAYPYSFNIVLLAIAAGSLNAIVLDTGVIVAPFRMWVRTVAINVQATPSYPGDVIAKAWIDGNGIGPNSMFIGQVWSTDTYQSIVFPVDRYLNIGEQLRIAADNYNAAIAYGVGGVISGELVY